MSEIQEADLEDLDSLIEYCPETNELDESNLISKESSPKIVPELLEVKTLVVYVCPLCYRQYELEDDIRGHLLLYHQCEPIATGDVDQNLNPICKIENEEIVSKQKPEPNDVSTVINDSELRPVPFKDFRLIIRSKMLIECTSSSNCSYRFETTVQLEHHLKCHTPEKDKFICFMCSMDFNNWRRCSIHLWKSHQLEVDLLKCPICEYKAHNSVLIWRHMRNHKKWKPRILCSLKAVKERRRRNLRKNLSKAIDEKPNSMAKRNRYYAEKTCEICNRKFVNGKTLSKHIKTVHNKIMPFICNICGKKSARKASLIIHMRQHTGEKPLQCKICKFGTRDPSVLHKHQLRHEKAGKFNCKICDYSCIQSSAYKRHMRLNHEEDFKKISCDLCNFTTINESKLEAHKEDHRKGLIVNNEDSMNAPPKPINKNDISTDCFMPLESIDSLPHEPAVDTGGVTIPAPSEDSQFPTYLNN
uniref:C2H2-type domain-containing protein n=1 Tax=Glossina brevipalpis TaxID=37001 RepID=A0A1A9X521_9MUSC